MPRTKYDKYITSEVLYKDPKNPNASVTSTRHLGDKWGGGHLSIDTHLRYPSPRDDYPSRISMSSLNT